MTFSDDKRSFLPSRTCSAAVLLAAVMLEKRSHTCPALVLHTGRAGKWQLLMGQQAWSPSKHRLFCRSKNPWGNGAKGRAELTPTINLHCAREPERARTRAVPWRCKSSRQGPTERAQRSPDKGLCSVLQRTRSNPQEHPLESALGVKKDSSPQMWGMRATFVEHEQRAPSHNGPKQPWQGAVLSAAEEGKKPPGTLASPLWGKKSLPPLSCRAQELSLIHI